MDVASVSEKIKIHTGLAITLPLLDFTLELFVADYLALLYSLAAFAKLFYYIKAVHDFVKVRVVR